MTNSMQSAAVANRRSGQRGVQSGAWLSLALLVLAGCGAAEAPRFRLNLEGRDVSQIDDPQTKLKGIVTTMVASFGEPDEPYVLPETGLDITKIKVAAGPVGSDAAGNQRGLYRQHCMHCHGISGDGDGPTARFLNPYPRDYRRGVFKFKSTERSARPTTADLKRILVEGIPGTAMPSFRLLPDAELDALVEYVKYLSMRGETEQFIFALVVDEEEELPLSRDLVVEQVAGVAASWQDAENQVIIPPEKPSPNIEEGRKLFLGADAQCTKCHGPTGLGDGGEKVFDDWNKDKKPENYHLYALPLQPLDPRNLRLGVYRGGRRPVDLYRRIFAGINGTPMPASGPAPGATKAPLTPEQIWYVVDYVLSLPLEPSSETGLAETGAAASVAARRLAQ